MDITIIIIVNAGSIQNQGEVHGKICQEVTTLKRLDSKKGIGMSEEKEIGIGSTKEKRRTIDIIDMKDLDELWRFYGEDETWGIGSMF